MNKDTMRKALRVDEDEVEYAYQDSEGYWTIGVGHLIDRRKGGKLSKASIDFILNEDIDAKWTELVRALPWVANLNEARQHVLLNMAFNLGVSGLLGFKDTIRLVGAGKYKEAAVAMLDSKWAKQVGDRAVRLAKMMEVGQ